MLKQQHGISDSTNCKFENTDTNQHKIRTSYYLPFSYNYSSSFRMNDQLPDASDTFLSSLLNNRSHERANMFNDSEHEYNITWIVGQPQEFYPTIPHYDQNYHDASLTNIHRYSATYTGFLACCTFLVNLVVIISITVNIKTRSDAFYKQVINFSITNVVIAIFILPLTVYQIVYIWKIGNFMCKFFTIADVVIPYVSFFILIILSCDRLIYSSHPNLYSWLYQKTFTWVVLTSPWVVSILIVVPMWTTEHDYYHNMHVCFHVISEFAQILTPILIYFIPCVFMAILTLLLLLRYRFGQRNGERFDTNRVSRNNNMFENDESKVTCSPVHALSDMDKRNLVRSNDNVRENHSMTVIRQDTTRSSVDRSDRKLARHKVFAVCQINALYCVMWFPFQFVSLLLSVCNSSSCVPSSVMIQVITLLAATSGAVEPLVWLNDRELQDNLKSIPGRIVRLKYSFLKSPKTVDPQDSIQS